MTDAFGPRSGDTFIELHPKLAQQSEIDELLRELSIKPVKRLRCVRLETEQPGWLANQVKLAHLSAYNYSKASSTYNSDTISNTIIIPLDAKQRADLTSLCERGVQEEDVCSPSCTSLMEYQRMMELLEPCFTNENSRYFVRLDTRSPKDSPWFGQPVCSARDCLRLLTTSDRVCFDLWQFEEAVCESCRGNAIVLAPWKDDLHRPDTVEFRCFVHSRVLTAISQYHTHRHFAVLDDVKQVERARHAILMFWLQIHDKLPYDDCTMDVAVHFGSVGSSACLSPSPFLSQTRPHVDLIEWNPLHEWTETSSACFDWRRDRAILLGVTFDGCPNQVPIRVVSRKQYARRKSV